MNTSSPSLKKNIVANYLSQAYTLSISIVMTPIYLRYMGIEAYGLIGFFTMMTAWFQLLDVGLTATLMRESARFRGGATGGSSLRILLRGLEVVFAAVSLVSAVVMALGAKYVATQWLKVGHLDPLEVTNSIILMGFSIPLRWTSGLYKGAIIGFERQVWIGGYGVFIATIRFVGVLAVFATLGSSPSKFFAYQLIVAIIELLGVMIMTYRLVPGPAVPFFRVSWLPVLGNLTFSLIIAFASTVWVIVTQVDKLILSKLLPLAEYGMFSVAVVAASAITAVGGPVGVALLPRLTKLIAQEDMAGATLLYRRATQVVCVAVMPAVTTLCFFAEPILQAWTGNPVIAHHAAPVLILYAIGNGFLAIGAFPYYMQYAKGDLRLHLIANAGMIILLIPLFILGARHWGGIGTGLVWACFNGLYVLLWTPIVHARVFKGQHWRWIGTDVVPITLVSVVAGWFLSSLIVLPAGRLATLACVLPLGALQMVSAFGASSEARQWIASLRTRRS